MSSPRLVIVSCHWNILNSHPYPNHSGIGKNTGELSEKSKEIRREKGGKK